MKLKKRNKVRAQMSMTSLTDVVFILLIFILVTHSIQSDPFLEILLPKSSKQSTAPDPIRVVASADRTVTINNRKVAWEDLPSAMEEVLKANPGANVSIKADERLKYDDVMTVVYIVNRLDGNPILALEPI